jgi:hypothetical protein
MAWHCRDIFKPPRRKQYQIAAGTIFDFVVSMFVTAFQTMAALLPMEKNLIPVIVR